MSVALRRQGGGWPHLVLGVTLFGLLSCAGDGDPPRKRSGSSDVLLVVVDALRADGLGAYGSLRATSPFLDRLSRRATLFEEAVSASSFTQESIGSLFTGLLPARHGGMGWGSSPREDVLTLAELLAVRGHDTGFFSNTPVLRNRKFHQGFRTAEILGERWNASGQGDHLSARVLEFAAQERSGPWFAYAHFLDPHGPYEPSGGAEHRFEHPRPEKPLRLYGRVRKQCAELVAQGFGPGDPAFEDLRGRYDAEISSIDRSIHRLVRGLRGQSERAPIIVVTSDHGEEFLEHGYVEHAWTLYDESLRVPLLVHESGGVGVIRRGRVSTLGVLPSILELIGGEAPAGLDGESLLAESTQPIVGELLITERNVVRSVSQDGWKYVAWVRRLPPEARPDAIALQNRRAGDPGADPDVWGEVVFEELFHLPSDPAERVNLIERYPERARRLGEVLDRLRERASEPEPAQTDPEDREALESLGYL